MIKFYIAQLWRLNNDMKLENKHGGWKYSRNSWKIPDEGQEGHIVNQETNEVLTIKDKASGKSDHRAKNPQSHT
jgi:hypothetical protein